MLRSATLCLLAFFSCFSTYAIEAVVSHTIFYTHKNDSAKNAYLELYWQVDPSTVGFTTNENGKLVANIKTEISFTAAEGNIIAKDKYVLQTNPTDSAQVLYQNILELHRYKLPPGKVKVSMVLTDVSNASKQFTYADSIMVDTPSSGVFYSGVELVDTAIDNGNESLFFKGGKQQIPFCINFYNDDRGKLHYYAELYNMDKVAKDLYPLRQQIYISKKPYEIKATNQVNLDSFKEGLSFLPVSGTMDLSTLGSGNYYLSIILQAKDKQKLAATSLFFQRSNKNPVTPVTSKEDSSGGFEKVEVMNLDQTFLKKYSTAQIKAILKMLMPISSPLERNAENNFMKRPEDGYMRYFIYNFWKSRNQTEPEKEWLLYVEKVKEVNKLFGSGVLPGYETDRGYIYLKYGKPNETITVENETGTLPYEIWQYNAPGKQHSPGSFLFYRPGFMISDYKLLHSSVNGEMRNTGWRSTLFTSGSASSSNSRAEQYFPGNK